MCTGGGPDGAGKGIQGRTTGWKYRHAELELLVTQSQQ